MNQKFALKASVLALASAFIIGSTNAQTPVVGINNTGGNTYASPSVAAQAPVYNDVNVHIVLANVVEFIMLQDWALLEYKTPADYQTGVSTNVKQFNITSNIGFDLSAVAKGGTFAPVAGTNPARIPVGDVDITADLTAATTAWANNSGTVTQVTTTNPNTKLSTSPQVILSSNTALQDDLGIIYSTKLANQRDFQIRADDYVQTVTYTVTQK